MTDFFDSDLDSDLDSDFDTDEERNAFLAQAFEELGNLPPEPDRDKERNAFLAQAFEELANLPPEPYRVKQQRVYRRSLKQGNTDAALDALWRASSEGNLLLDHEVNHYQFTPERTAELKFMLGWD